MNRTLMISLALILGVVSIAVILLPQAYQPADLVARPDHRYPAEFAEQEKQYHIAVQRLDRNNDDPVALAALARVFIEEARVSEQFDYYYKAAMEAIDHGLDHHDDHIELLVLKTSVLLSTHRFAEAQDLALMLTHRMPASHIAWGMLCDAETELGHLPEAVAAADQMMRLRPGLDAYARVSHLRERHGDLEGALEAMHMAAQAGLPGTHDAAWARTTYGDLLQKDGRNEEARAQWQLASIERSDYPEAVRRLNNAPTEKGSHAQGHDHDHDHRNQHHHGIR